jgi:hypothetical protein
MSRRVVGLRVACALMVITFFVTGQTLHAAAAMRGPCSLKAATTKHAHMDRTGQHSAHQGGCCCEKSAPCDCDFNRGSNDEGSALPVTAATYSTSLTSLNALAVPTCIAVVAHSPEKTLHPDWVRARAPSETLLPNTTKLIC